MTKTNPYQLTCRSVWIDNNHSPAIVRFIGNGHWHQRSFRHSFHCESSRFAANGHRIHHQMPPFAVATFFNPSFCSEKGAEPLSIYREQCNKATHWGIVRLTVAMIAWTNRRSIIENAGIIYAFVVPLAWVKRRQCQHRIPIPGSRSEFPKTQ